MAYDTTESVEEFDLAFMAWDVAGASFYPFWFSADNPADSRCPERQAFQVKLEDLH